MILIEDGQIFSKSTAALRTTKHLDKLWSAMTILLVIPRPLRDMVYDRIGKRRFRFLENEMYVGYLMLMPIFKTGF